MFLDSIQECQMKTCHRIALYKVVFEALPIIRVPARMAVLCEPCTENDLAAGIITNQDVEPLHITKGMMVRALKGMLHAVRNELSGNGGQRDFTLMELVGNMGISPSRRDLIILVRDALSDILKGGRLIRALPTQGDLRMQVIVPSQVTMPRMPGLPGMPTMSEMQGMPGMPGMLAAPDDDEQSDFGPSDWMSR